MKRPRGVRRATPRPLWNSETVSTSTAFDKGNGAALINHRRRGPNCCLLREKGKVWIIAGVEGIEAGEELTYDYGSDYYPRNGPKRPATLKR